MRRLLALFALIAGLAAPAHGQVTEFLGAAPQAYALRYDYQDESRTHQFVLSGARRVPIALLLPNASPESELVFLFAAVGARSSTVGRSETIGGTTPRERQTAFRWRAGLLDVNLYRAPYGGGLTLVDIDRAGLADLHARWAELRLGPSFRLGGFRFAVEPRVIGAVGLSTFRPGAVSYGGLLENADHTRTGPELGLSPSLSFHIGPYISLRFFGQMQRHMAGRDLILTRAGAALDWWPEARLQLFGQATYERIREVDPDPISDYDFGFYRLGLRFTPAALRF